MLFPATTPRSPSLVLKQQPRSCCGSGTRETPVLLLGVIWEEKWGTGGWHCPGAGSIHQTCTAPTAEKEFPSPKHSRLNLPFPCFLSTDHLFHYTPNGTCNKTMARQPHSPRCQATRLPRARAKAKQSCLGHTRARKSPCACCSTGETPLGIIS